MKSRILVVDDERLIRWSLRERLSKEGYEVVEAPDSASAQGLLQSQAFDMALFDLKLPDGDGMSLVRLTQEIHPETIVVIITAHSSVDTAVEAMKQGAYDYVSKPFNLDELAILVKRGLETQRLRRSVGADMEQKRQRFGLECIVGQSEAISEIKRLLRRVAGSDATTVLLLGETGGGKDMAARVIHYESRRREMPFMNITCTAMPESLIESELFGYEAGAFTDARGLKKGLFELANHGTVYLDEIGDMPPSLQAKLLRVLEEKAFRRIGGVADIEVDCRVIAATNRDLHQLMGEGKFRDDLFYRLSILPIVLPPLRERTGDVALLADHFLESYQRKMGREFQGFSPAANRRLMNYEWPGNVRELRNTIERAVLLAAGPVIEHDDIVLSRAERSGAAKPRYRFPLPPEGCDLTEVEHELVVQALERTQGNQTRAAEFLGISRDQIRYKMEKHGLIQ